MSIHAQRKGVDFEERGAPNRIFQNLQMVQMCLLVPEDFAVFDVRPIHDFGFRQREVRARDLDQLYQRLHPAIPSAAQQRSQDVRGRQRVPERAMAGRVVDPEERRHVIEPPVAQLGHEAAGQTDRTQGLAHRRGDADGGAFGRQEPPVKAGVVGDEYAGLERPAETGGNVLEPGATDDQAVGDTGEARHPRRDRDTGVEQRLEGKVDGAALEDRHRHFEDAPAVLGPPPPPGRLHIDDGEAGVLEGWRGEGQARGHRVGAATSCSGGRRRPAPARSRPS